MGDCINVSGTTTEFNGGTEIVSVSALSLASACGAMPVPAAIELSSVATDTDPLTAGDTAGADAEVFEGVLVTVTQVFVASEPTADGSYRVSPSDNPLLTLLVTGFLGGGAAATFGQSFVAITGVVGQYGTFRIQPRTAADTVSF